MAVNYGPTFTSGVEVRFPTPGPQSYGDPEAVAIQRRDLGLDDHELGDAPKPLEGSDVVAPADPATFQAN